MDATYYLKARAGAHFSERAVKFRRERIILHLVHCYGAESERDVLTKARHEYDHGQPSRDDETKVTLALLYAFCASLDVSPAPHETVSDTDFKRLATAQSSKTELMRQLLYIYAESAIRLARKLRRNIFLCKLHLRRKHILR